MHRSEYITGHPQHPTIQQWYNQHNHTYKSLTLNKKKLNRWQKHIIKNTTYTHLNSTSLIYSWPLRHIHYSGPNNWHVQHDWNFLNFWKLKINSKKNISSTFSKLKRWLLMQLLMFYLMHIVPSIENPYYGYYTKSNVNPKNPKNYQKVHFF